MSRRAAPRTAVRRPFAVGLALLLIATLCATASAAPGSDAPFLWQVKGARTTHYLLGSIHMLPASAYPLPPAIEQAYAQTQALVLETDPAALERPETQALMIQAGLSERGLAKEVGSSLHDRVKARAVASELPATICDRFKPWLCALSLTLLEFQRAGMDAELGLDRHFHRRALADRRAVTWLETPESQIALFADMDPGLSAQFLASTLDDLSAPEWQPAATLKMWRDNDVAGLGALIDESGAEFSETHARVLGNRNRAWIDGLLDRFAGATPQLVVVGAAHLAGKDNVIELLQARGIEVRPVSR